MPQFGPNANAPCPVPRARVPVPVPPRPPGLGLGRRLGGQPGQLYEILATARPLGPGGSWDGLGVLRGVQLGPWPLGSVAVAGGRGR
jgi:hypothetical protein